MSDAPLVPIVQVGAPILRAPAVDVPREVIATPEFRDLVATMIATMRAAPGVGLAAPQIGVPWRVFVLEDKDDLSGLTAAERRERGRVPFDIRVLVNPVLRPIGEERATFFEGCLSVDGYAALVERSHEVEVAGLDEHGEPSTVGAQGWPARILQHEMDHLDGVLYVDRMLTRSFSTVDQAKALYGGKSIEEVRRMLGV
jgi:peptide deformylase